ncbi:hypothetical protein SGQ44_07895 [Flavobacterium sp. Fl-77]|uniref:Uncharacterized protein n=1 Tax=Flavobacterium flavipigmentatum TaxID=2893884 RepID=A0AAJ2SAS5_9FLAO|nr:MULTISPECIES: hypothetical protein [unclassified Flavobacterium]MDX6182413.1 hypothetical protein [Flavobacterium sp. Fl-33]MDX6185674.1 hypothetical protein [Flavobacterium sp. Fl-77]UFH38858.1 hypothetical protein LNP22_00945 [Flavobacterium sp. F-70]
MKNILFSVFILLTSIAVFGQGNNANPSFTNSLDLQIQSTTATFSKDLQQIVFKIQVQGTAGLSKPTAYGQLNGAPVLGYVFPTTLSPTDVGFNQTSGIVALALTSHPDFDDTPLWDENFDNNFENDGLVWHAHWVILENNTAVAGGLSVKEFVQGDTTVKLPPTNPGMPMYMDSPGYSVVTKTNTIKVIVPAYRINNKTNFNFDAVAAYMEVNTSNPAYPMLGVYAVYSVASGNLSLPYTVTIN